MIRYEVWVWEQAGEECEATVFPRDEEGYLVDEVAVGHGTTVADALRDAAEELERILARDAEDEDEGGEE